MSKTMDDMYGDSSDHDACETCGLCNTCGDCNRHGCGQKQVGSGVRSVEAMPR